MGGLLKALYGVWKVIPFRKTLLLGTLFDQKLNRGRLTDPVIDTAKDAGKHLWEAATDSKKREELYNDVGKTYDGVKQKVETARTKLDTVAKFVDDPTKSIADAASDVAKETLEKTKKDGMLGSIFDFFKDDDGINWTKAGGAGVGAFLLYKMFGGGGNNGGSFLGGALKLGVLATVATVVVKNWDEISKSAHQLADNFSQATQTAPAAASGAGLSGNPFAPETTSIGSAFKGNAGQTYAVNVGSDSALGRQFGNTSKLGKSLISAGVRSPDAPHTGEEYTLEA